MQDFHQLATIAPDCRIIFGKVANYRAEISDMHGLQRPELGISEFNPLYLEDVLDLMSCGQITASFSQVAILRAISLGKL